MSGISWSTMLVLVITAVISPFSLVAFSLVLATDRGPKNGIWFIFGWIVTVFAICMVSVSIGDAAGASTSSSSSTTSDVTFGIQIALGAVLLMMWIRRRIRARIGLPDPLTADLEAADAAEAPVGDAPEPAWRRKIATMKAPGAFVMGGATQTWPVMIAGGAEIAHAVPMGAEAIALSLGFALATTIGIVILEVLAWRNPSSAPERLRRIENYVASHRDTVVSWILLIGGIYLLGRGIYGVVSG